MGKKITVPPDFKIPEDYRVIEYPFHLGDLASGTAHLTNAQFGAYIRIILTLVNKHDGMTLEQIKKYSRMGKHWQEFWILIEDKFILEGDMLIHKRVRETTHQMAYVSVKNALNALNKNNSDGANSEPKPASGCANHKTNKPIKNKNKKNGETEFNNQGSSRALEALASPDLIEDLDEWKRNLVEDLGAAAVKSWFSDAVQDGSKLVVNSYFCRDWIKNNYHKQLKKIGVEEIIVKC